MKSFKTILGLFALLLMMAVVLPSCGFDSAQPPSFDSAQVAVKDSVVTVDTSTVSVPDSVGCYPMHPPTGEASVVPAAVQATTVKEQSIGDFMKANWEVLLIALMALAKVIVNLTPTSKDNRIFGLLDDLINAVFVNRKNGGGTHPTA